MSDNLKSYEKIERVIFDQLGTVSDDAKLIVISMMAVGKAIMLSHEEPENKPDTDKPETDRYSTALKTYTVAVGSEERWTPTALWFESVQAYNKDHAMNNALRACANAWDQETTENLVVVFVLEGEHKALYWAPE